MWISESRLTCRPISSSSARQTCQAGVTVRGHVRARACVCVCVRVCVCVCVCLFRGIIPLVVCSKLSTKKENLNLGGNLDSQACQPHFRRLSTRMVVSTTPCASRALLESPSAAWVLRVSKDKEEAGPAWCSTVLLWAHAAAGLQPPATLAHSQSDGAAA